MSGVCTRFLTRANRYCSTKSSGVFGGGSIFTRNRAKGEVNAWLLTDLLTNKKTRPIACRLWGLQPPKLKNLRTNLTRRTRRFSTALGKQETRLAELADLNSARISWIPASAGMTQQNSVVSESRIVARSHQDPSGEGEGSANVMLERFLPVNGTRQDDISAV